jgi:hypothetical protein
MFAIREAMNKMRIKCPRKKIIEARPSKYVNMRALRDEFPNTIESDVYPPHQDGGFLTNS